MKVFQDEKNDPIEEVGMIKKLGTGRGIISRQHVVVFLMIMVAFLFLTSCAAGPNKMEDSKNLKGKAFLSLPKGALPMHPLLVDQVQNTQLASITNEGRMLLFPLKHLPVLPKENPYLK